MVTLEEIQASEWYQTRPLAVQKRIDTHPPNKLYRLSTTGQIVPLYSYEVDNQGECNTCKVHVLREHNPEVILERTVFGVPFENLVPIEEQGAEHEVG